MKVWRFCNHTNVVRVYRYTVEDGGKGVKGGFEVHAPQMSRFIVNPSNSTANVLRDIMFLDEMDLLVVGTVDGSEMSV